MNIALLSPNQNAYSETFIQAHKHRLRGNVFYYFGGRLPSHMEGRGLLKNTRWERILNIIKEKFYLNKFSLKEAAFVRSLKYNKIDLVFAEYGFTGQKVHHLCRELNLPLIVHFHGYDASRKEEIVNNNQYKELFDYATFVIAVSKKMFSVLLKLGCPEEKIIYNVYGPQEEFFKVKPHFTKPQFISIGRLIDKKAPHYLILSFLKVVKEFPEAKLLIGANGPLLSVCKQLVDYWGVNSNIEFVGVITPEEFRSYLRESLAFVQHSITAENGDAEGTPVSILEAGAAGLPVISTYHAGIPEVITPGENGLLVEEHDVNGMAERMITLLKDFSYAKELGEKGRENVQKNFTLEKHIETLNDLIGRALSIKKK
ncbi:MAG: glycosyltransferase family 4 protein [Bacteroidota bacterium]